MIFRLIAVCFFSAVVALATVVWRAPDPRYKLAELAAMGRFSEFDREIAEVAKASRIDPRLLKSMAWKASGFHPGAVSGGRRGLLLVREAAARQWAAVMRVDSFMLTDLSDARTNLQAGAWVLARALERWKGRDDTLAFALAEFYAGREEIERRGAGFDTAAGMLRMTGRETREFVEAVISRFRFYGIED